MRSNRHRIALILSIGLILTSIPITGSRVGAETLTDPAEILEAMESVDIVETGDLKDPDHVDLDQGNSETEPDYVEGDVIVCIRTGESQSSGVDGEITNNRAGAVAGLLDEAEDLMDVTEAVKELQETDPSADHISNDKAAAEDEYTLKFIHSDRYSTDQMIEMLENDPDVLFAEPNYIYHLADDLEEEELAEDDETGRILTEAPAEIEEDNEESGEDKPVNANETVTSDRSGSEFRSVDLTGLQYAYGKDPGGIDVPYWNNPDYKNAENTVVAVLDTGVDYNHEDLKEVMWADGLMYPELTSLGGGKYGYTAVDSSSTGIPYFSYDPMDDHSHGTHCAGSIGAPWNGYGVSGTANGTRIMAVKAANEKGGLSDKSKLKGFNYIKAAKEAGVDITAVNCSWGGRIITNSDQLAVKEITKLNVVFCFASGNEDTDNDYIQLTASALREEDGVICVNSNDSEGKKSYFSNFGARTTDLSAPGSGILSTIPTGAGLLDPAICTPVKDVSGNYVKDDFQGDETYFSYENMNGASHEIAEDGGRKVLKIDGMQEKMSFLSIKSGSLPEKPEYFAISSRYEVTNSLAVYVGVLCHDGKFHIVNPQYYISADYGSKNVYKLPDNMDLEHPEIRLYSDFDPGESGKPYYIKAISFVMSPSDYGYKSGTSMATPAVTGEVAVLASKWPDDSAKRRAARVVGSIKDVPELVNTSRTGGIANVRNALECDYAPVVNRAWVDEEGDLNVSGYFFGNEKGSIEILSGSSALTGCTVANWKGLREDEWDDNGKNDEDVIKVSAEPGGWPDSEVKIIVTSSGLKKGSRMLLIRGAGDFAANKSCYDRLTVPVPADGDQYKHFVRSYFNRGTALGGVIYYTGFEIDEEGMNYTMWKCTLSGNGVSPSWEKSHLVLQAYNQSNICAWNGMLVYRDESDNYIKLYSPKEDMIYDTGIGIQDAEGIKYPNVAFVNADGELFVLVSEQEEKSVSGNKQYVDKDTQLYRIDIQKKTMYLLGTLASIQKNPVITANKDGSGKVIITLMTKKDETSIEKEVINVNEDEMTSVSETIGLASGISFDGQDLTGAACQYGIVLAGPADKADNGDNFLYSPDDKSITKCAKQITADRPAWNVVTEYKGRTYFLCPDIYSDDGISFAVADDDEFRGSGEVKEPLHYYGDDESCDDHKLTGSVELKASNEGHVPIGKSIGLTPAIKGKDGKKINYIWYSEDAFIASVDQNGKVTGKSAGSTYIHAVGRDADGNEYEGKCYVSVYTRITGIRMDKKKLDFEGGDRFLVEAHLTPVEASGKYVEWSVSLPASYPGAVIKTEEWSDAEGCYAKFSTKDVGENYKVTITARTTDGSNKKATCQVTVNKPVPKPEPVPLPVKSAALSDTGTIYLGAGMEHDISLVRVQPADCNAYTVTWKSSNSSVAVTGDSTDKNTAVIHGNKKGTAKITAVITNTAPGGKKTVTVKGLTVKVLQSALSGNSVKIFNKKKDISGLSSNRLAVGKKLTLKANVYRDGKALKAGKTKIIWSSSDPSAASVVNGKVKAYKEGWVRLTAALVPSVTSGVPVISESCDFYVYNPVKSIRVDQYSYSGQLMYRGIGKVNAVTGDYYFLKAEPIVASKIPGDTVREEKKFIWTSSNTDVAYVLEYAAGSGDTYDVLVPKKPGKAVITLKAKDGSNKKVSFKVTVFERVKGIKITAKKLGKATVNTYNASELTVRGLAKNKTFKISPNIEPATASNKAVVYTSSNPSAITVSKKGVVKRKGAGDADVYVTTVDGGYTAVCHVVE